MRAWLVPVIVAGCVVPAGIFLTEQPAASAPRSSSVTVQHGKPPPVPASVQATGRALLVRAMQAAVPTKPVTASRVAHLDQALQAQASTSSAKTMKVTVAGSPAQIVAAVARLGGSVDAVTPHAVSAVVPRSGLTALAGSAGVTQVSRPVPAFEESTPCSGASCSQGVAESAAATWQTGSNTGSGVTIGIVDGGFENLSTEQAAGNLPMTNAGLTLTSHCANVNGSPHGTAVAEIVHQMAPGASLMLECVDNNLDFEAAATDLVNAGVKIVNSSLAFPGDSRGDGTGGADSAATTVENARRAGILWIESAGNNASDNWSGSFNGPDGNGLVNLDPSHRTSTPNVDTDVVAVAPESTAQIVLQWDQWPVSSAKVTLLALGQQCESASTCTSPTTIASSPGCSTTYCITQPSNSPPVLSIPIANNTADTQVWTVGIAVQAPVTARHYDLSYWGDVSSNILACDANGSVDCNSPASAAGSITEPASSPYALAVGAVDGSGDNACESDLPAANSPGDSGSYPLEAFSSQGPTIDGRIKPDILAFDGINSNEFPGGFCGTSSAAPHVAGAAALALAADPSMDAAQLQAFLEQRASGTVNAVANNPATNASGHGVLDLGSLPPIATPAGSTYTGLATPVRAFDTRVSPGARLAGGHSITVDIAAAVPSLPADATAVAINLTATNSTGNGYLSAYAAGASFPGTSNLNVTGTTDSTAAVFAVVTLGTNRSIQVLNGSPSNVAMNVIVDVVGYFSPSGSGWQYTSAAGTRLLDTRTAIGNAQGLLKSGQTVTVDTGMSFPSGGAAVVNVTATNMTGSGWLHLDSATPAQPIRTSTLNYTQFPRANLAVVAVSSSGTFTITDGGGAGTYVVVDLIGTFSPTPGSLFVPLPAPVRIVDTRTGNGGLLSPLGAATTMTDYVAGVGEIASGASALLLGVTAVSAVPSGSSYFTVYPTGTSPRPPTSTQNFSGRRVVPNAAIANLNPHIYAVNIYNQLASAQAVVDVFGYFL